jgi:hypothetical protein
MANMNIGTPRFYPDLINHLMSRGVAQDGNFDVITGTNLIGIQTGTEAELFDMNPLNKVDFNTSASTSDHVLINLDFQAASSFRNTYIAILNHNLASCSGKIQIAASATESDVNSADMGGSHINTLEVVNADTIDGSSPYEITPATDGTTIVKLNPASGSYTPLQYVGIQFEGDSTFDGSTDLSIGCIMVGQMYEMPHAPDLNITRMISYNRMNDLQESYGGQRFSNLKSFGRTSTSTSKSPFTTASDNYQGYGGRLIYDMNFSFIDSSNIMPAEYDVRAPGHLAADQNFVEDVWNKTNGNHIPFIFSIDKDSEGDNAESEHIFGRFANNSLDMSQVSPNIFNLKLTVEEEF